MTLYMRTVRKCAFVCAGLLWMILPLAAQQGALRRNTETPEERAARMQEAAAKPTPRTADGRPDLSGYWAPDRSRVGFDAVPVTVSDDGTTVTYHEPEVPDLDANQANFKERAANPELRPPYKPELMAKHRELLYTSSLVDPGIHCYPLGVPRIGAPTEIVQTPAAIYLMYAGEVDEEVTHTFRIVPIGGQRDPNGDPTPNGDSVAWWEGDTLVIDVVNLDPDTWLDGDGTFHSDAMHVVERFTRKGDTLEYDVTIEDPKVFTRPWRPVGGRNQVGGRLGSATRTLREPGLHPPSDFPCVERDREHKVNYDRFF